MSGGASPVITRLYQMSPELESCTEAVRLLLNSRRIEQKRGPMTALDGAVRSEYGCDAKITVRR